MDKYTDGKHDGEEIIAGEMSAQTPWIAFDGNSTRKRIQNIAIEITTKENYIYR